MPHRKQIDPRVYKTGRCLPLLPRLESRLYSSNALARNNHYHVLDYSDAQLNELEQMLSIPGSDKGALIPEVIKRLKGYEPVFIINKLKTEPSDLMKELYHIALIERLNKMRDDTVFSFTATHWEAFDEDQQNNTYLPLSAFLIFKKRLTLVMQNNPVYYTQLTQPLRSAEAQWKAKLIIQNMGQSHESLVKFSEAAQFVYIPAVERHSSAYLLAGEIADTLYWLAWNTYYYTIGWFTYPFYLLGMAAMDQVRRVAIYFTQWSLNTHPIFKVPITAIGSGTALVGILGALSAFGAPVIAGAALGTTGLVIAGAVNFFASSDLKDKRLSPKTLTQVFTVCCFAAAASAMMAQSGIEKLLLHFKYGDNIPADGQLEGREYDGAFWGGIILAGFNFFTSLRSTYGASTRFLNDLDDPQSHYNLANRASFTKRMAIQIFTLITLSVALVYSVSITEKLTKKQFSDAIKTNLPVLEVICAANLTTAAIFINRTIDWIYTMCHREQEVSGRKEWIAMLGGVFCIGSFYIISAFGNAKGSAETLWDNDYWENALSGIMALAVFPSTWLTIKTIMRYVESKYRSRQAVLGIDFPATDGEQQPLLFDGDNHRRTSTPEEAAGFPA